MKTCRGTQTNKNVMCYEMCNAMLMWHSAKFCRCVCMGCAQSTPPECGSQHGHCREDKFVFIKAICAIEFVFLGAVERFSLANLVGKPKGGGN